MKQTETRATYLTIFRFSGLHSLHRFRDLIRSGSVVGSGRRKTRKEKNTFVGEFSRAHDPCMGEVRRSSLVPPTQVSILLRKGDKESSEENNSVPFKGSKLPYVPSTMARFLTRAAARRGTCAPIYLPR